MMNKYVLVHITKKINKYKILGTLELTNYDASMLKQAYKLAGMNYILRKQ